MNHLNRSIRFFSVLLCVCTLVIWVGCGKAKRAAKVDEALAVETLHRTLKSWQSGKKVDAGQSERPPVIAQENDWSEGLVLEEYEILSQQRRDANLFISVRLKLRDGNSENAEPVTKNRTYIVGTSPVLTVFRDFN
jgi:hypothetical protein